MKDLFFMGGPKYMAILSVLFIITTAWIIYHFVAAYKTKEIKPEKLLRKIGYGKSMGLFTLIVAITGQMSGFFCMFSAIEEAIQRGEEVIPELVYGGIKVTMICTFYGMFIYLFSWLLWFVSSILIERKFK